MKSRSLIVLSCFLLMLMLASCRREAQVAAPTAAPTLTPTPRSTPLPSLPTPIPPGAAANPLQMVIRAPGLVSDARAAVPAVEAALLEQSGLVISILVVERDAEALASVCSPGAQPSVAWLGGLAYVAARAQNCGEAVLQVQRTIQREDKTGETVSVIVPTEGASAVSGLRDKTFCRLNNLDLYTWLIPALMLRAEGLDPTALGTVQDFPQLSQMVPALVAGDCDVAGVSTSALEVTGGELSTSREQVKVLAESPVFPYGVLIVPPEVPLGARLALTQALTTLAEPGSSSAVQLRSLLGQSALLPFSEDDFRDLDRFINRTGLDFTQLGDS